METLEGDEGESVRVPAKLAYLGQALDMVLERGGQRSTIGWTRRHWVCTDAKRESIWIFPAPREKGRPLRDGEASDLADVVRLWSQFEPTRQTLVEYRVGKTTPRGSCVSLAYRSDKWSGKPADYEHAFDYPARVVQAGDVYRLTGPRLRVTAVGITG